MKKWISRNFSFITVRGKVMILSKLLGISFIGIFFAGINGTGENIIWYILLTSIIILFDIILGKIVTEPLTRINEAARQIAELNFPVSSNVHTNDEFGELSKTLNKLSSNLQDALNSLKIEKTTLEKEVSQKKMLLTERKELTDTLSHEMKTPLSIVRAYAEALIDDVKETKRKEYIDVILSETNRMTDMIISLLDLSSLEAGATKLNPELFDFVELVETVAGRLLIDQPTDTFKLKYNLPNERVYIHADKKRMEQVLSNLIDNAKKNVSNYGTIDLSIIVNLDKTVEFHLFNQGIPIRKDALPYIWDKFYKDKNVEKKSGTGLGLSIVAQILSMEEIYYTVENCKDGVEFKFIIPRSS